MGYKVYYGTLTYPEIGYYSWNSRTLIYDTANPDDKNYLIDPVLDMEGNEAGSFEAYVPKTNVCWDSLKLMLGTIEVEEDGEIIWQGRITEITEDFDLNRYIYCEGELAYMNDQYIAVDWSKMQGVSLAAGGAWTYFPFNYFWEYCYCGINYNGKAIVPVNWVDEITGDLDRISEIEGMGKAEASSADQNIQVGDTVYKSAWEALKNDLLDGMLKKYDGYAFIKLRRKKSGSSYRRELVLIVVDPEKEDGSVLVGRGQVEKTKQTIEFGKNLMDINVERGVTENMITQAIAFGYQEKGWWIFKKVTPISGMYVDEAAASKYGIIQKAFVVDGTNSSSNTLIEAAKASMPSEGNGEYKTVEAKAIDLYDAGEATDRLGFLKMTHIVSAPHGVDSWLLCTKAHIPLDKPADKEFNFGRTKTKLSTSQANVKSTSDKGYYMSRSASSYLSDAGMSSGGSETKPTE